jgi:hypothetical protein
MRRVLDSFSVNSEVMCSRLNCVRLETSRNFFDMAVIGSAASGNTTSTISVSCQSRQSM